MHVHIAILTLPLLTFSFSSKSTTSISKRQQSIVFIHTLNTALALGQSVGKWQCFSSSRMCGWFLNADNVAIFISWLVILLHFLRLSWWPNGCHQFSGNPNYLYSVMFSVYTEKLWSIITLHHMFSLLLWLVLVCTSHNLTMLLVYL